MTIRTRSATALLGLSAAVGACGGTASTSSPPAQSQTPVQTEAGAVASTTAPPNSTAAINACALITEQEATAFLGSDPGPGMDTGSATSPACAYGASLTVVVEPTDGEAAFASTKSAMEGSGKGQDLNGVGDAGFVYIVADTIAQMEILKGSSLLTVNVQGDPSRQNITLAALTALGTTAVGRL